MNEHLWIDPAEPLRNLARVLNFSPDSLSLAEKPDGLTYTPEFSPKDLAFPPNDPEKTKKLAELDAAFKRLRSRYGSAVILKFKIGNLEILNLDYGAVELEKFYQQALKGKVGLDLILNKQDLQAHWKVADPLALTKLFLFPEALVRALSVPLKELEQSANSVFKGFTGDRKLILLAPDHNAQDPTKGLQLNGEYLAVLGGASVARWREFLPQPAPVGVSPKLNVYAEAVNNLKWTRVLLQRLTPLHLNVNCRDVTTGVEQKPNKSDPIVSALLAQMLALSVLYTARESRFPENNGGPWPAVYAADKYLARIEVPQTASISAMLLSDRVPKPWDVYTSIAQLVEWVYKEKLGIGNRLEVVQAVVASFMEDYEASKSLEQLVLKAAEIFQRVESRWTAFIDEKLKKYFSQIKELEERVESTTKSYNEQVQTLTKGITDNMLAAIAVVVGSFIAAIFKSPFQTYIFVFGVLIYTLYLLAFPMIVGLTSAWQRFKDARNGFRKHQLEFTKRLSEDEVNDIVGTRVSENESRFKTWYRTTWILYSVVVALMVLAMLVVPSTLKRWTDSFRLVGASYDAPSDREMVPLVIRGDGFDNTKEIIVTVGNSKLSNTDGKSVKVHGATVLTLAPRRADLADATLKNDVIHVRQGGADEQTLALPATIPPPAEPAFELWTWNENGSLEATGSKFTLIPQLQSDGAKVPFKVSDDGRKLEITDQKALQKLRASRTLEIGYKDGIKARVSLPASPNKPKS